jgi:glycosyltransferase involved in cell wall biosynthesis
MWFYGRPLRGFFHPLNLYELATSRAGQFSVMSAFSWRAYMAWRDLHREHRFDVVHDVQSLGYGSLMIHASAMPMVANIHHPLSIDRMNQVRQARTVGLKMRKAMFYPFFMQEIVARRMDCIITGSHNSRASVQDAFALRDDRIMTIHDGVDTRVFRPLELPRRPNGLLYVGNSDDRNKGARYLIEAAALLRDRGVDFHLSFVDRPGAEAAPRMVAKRGLADRVTFVNHERAERGLGRLSDADLARAYNEAQIVVSPSLYEGFGLPAAEAMACGTPVVATTAGAFPEVVAAGETGVLVPPGDAVALAGAIQSLLADPDRRIAMGAAGVERINAHFSWRVCAEKTAALYEDVLERRKGGRDA